MNTSNFDKAKIQADVVDEKIINTLEEGKSFRVEAGAGSGKTYSLTKVINWIENNKWNEFKNKHQQVACITYTNVAVDVIASRLKKDSFIVPSTIHAFAWNAIKQFQEFLLNEVKTNEMFNSLGDDRNNIKQVQYELGKRFIENDILYLYHDDVIKLFVKILDNPKFRMIFMSKFPVILIDEYQDSFKIIIDQFKKYFISSKKGPQFGFFGDAWQTIYQSNNPCGIIEDNNIQEIKKSSNFRSANNIVSLLNKIRPDLPQISAVDKCQGDIYVVHCNDYSGIRRQERNFQDELPVEELKSRLKKLEDIFFDKNSSNKTLMITHRVLSEQQGYEQILQAIDDKLKNNEDDLLRFFEKTIEPIFNALKTSNPEELYSALGIKSTPIKNRSYKLKWKHFYEDLIVARSQKAIDVLNFVFESDLVPFPPKITNIYNSYNQTPDNIYYNKTTFRNYLNIQYKQFLSAINFLKPESIYSTNHGVKGEEYDNVIFSISKGWNIYNFDKYIPQLRNPLENDSSFIRNRNLFYVCCSRARYKLLIFISSPMSKPFETFLKELVPSENFLSYTEFENKFNDKCTE